MKSCDEAGDVTQGLAWFPLPELKTKQGYIHKTLIVGTTHSSSSHGRAAVQRKVGDALLSVAGGCFAADGSVWYGLGPAIPVLQGSE